MTFKAGDQIFKITRYQMLFTGTWPLTDHWPKIYRVLYKMYYLLASFWGVYGAPLASIIVIYQNLVLYDDFEKAVETMSFFVLTTLAMVKLHYSQTPDMVGLLKSAIELANETSERSVPEVTNILRKYSRYSIVLNAVLYSVNVSLCLMFNLSIRGEINDYIEKNPDEPPPLRMFVHWYPFDMRKHFRLTLFLHEMSAFFFGFYNAIVQSLIITIMIHSAGQLEVLKQNLRTFHVAGRDERVSLKRLKELVVRHQDLIVFVKKFNRSIQCPMILEYNMTTFLMASVLIQITQGERLNFNVYYLIAVTFQLLSICYNANEIQVISMQLGAAIYESLWFECRLKEIHQVTSVILSRSTKPLLLTVGPFGPITASTGLGRLKVAYSYMSIISGRN